MKSKFKSKSKSKSSSSWILIILVVLFVGFCGWAYEAACPPPPKKLGSQDITSPRIKLRDGRHLSYIESGAPKDKAKSKLIYVHGFDSCKYYNPFAISASPALVEELGVYIVALDRPGYGQSDPDPKRTVKSLSLDIEEFADHLNLGPKFYVAGYSMGGQLIWSCLKYIPHRLAGAVLISPAVNYWWGNIPLKLRNEAFRRQLQQDQWSMRVAHHLPWLTYWWNTQKWFPSFSVIAGVNPAIFSTFDLEVMSNMAARLDHNLTQALKSQPRLQGEFESLHRDMNIAFGKWEFDPTDVENPFPNNNGSVHIWMADGDLIVPVTLQRYIAQQLRWVKYHEVAGGGHLILLLMGCLILFLKHFLINVKNNFNYLTVYNKKKVLHLVVVNLTIVCF